MTDHTIGYIVGSISSTSINRRLAKALEKVAPEGVTLKEIPIKDLPFYSPDYDGNFPQVAVDFKNVDIVFGNEKPRALAMIDTGATRQEILAQLKGTYDEKPTAFGTTGTGGVVELTTSKSGSWTLMLSLPNGRACLIATGEDWEQWTQQLTGRDS